MGSSISAIIVGFNEGYLLKECMDSIQFCDEILYFDMGSEDDSEQIASNFGATVRQVEKENLVEGVQSRVYANAQYEWILFIDPDERISSALSEVILQEIDGADKSTGAFSVPWQFYLKSKKLRGTPWGYHNRKVMLFHKDRLHFTSRVHTGRQVRDGYEVKEIGMYGVDVCQHLWATGYSQLVNKHKRHLRVEGESRYKAGQRVRVKSILAIPFREFRYSLVNKKGYTDGLTGFVLSLFWAWYKTAASIQLLEYQKKVQNNTSNN